MNLVIFYEAHICDTIWGRSHDIASVRDLKEKRGMAIWPRLPIRLRVGFEKTGGLKKKKKTVRGVHGQVPPAAVNFAVLEMPVIIVLNRGSSWVSRAHVTAKCPSGAQRLPLGVRGPKTHRE